MFPLLFELSAKKPRMHAKKARGNVSEIVRRPIYGTVQLDPLLAA